MPVGDWSTDPAQNDTTLNGINLGENAMSPSDINNMGRQIMADVKVKFDSLPTATGKMNIAGGVFTGDITRSGRGAYSHYFDSTLASAREYVQPVGGSVPAEMQNGDKLIEYTP